ncbi:hypothetical protein ACHAWF_017735 [Thalassiosira exigua]
MWESHMAKLNKGWEDRMKEYIEHTTKEGNPAKSMSSVLKRWNFTQQNLFSKGELRQDRADRLKAAGFNFDSTRRMALEEEWNSKLEDLIRYKSTHSGNDPPPTDKSLGRWCKEQIQAFRQRKLKQDREDRLNGIGFDFTSGKSEPESGEEPKKDWYIELKQFYVDHGHSDVTCTAGCPRFVKWVSRLRGKFKKGLLSEEKVSKLREVCFSFELDRNAQRKIASKHWEDKYNQMVIFYESNGHCNIGEDENPSLARWFHAMEYNPTLTNARRKQLEWLLEKDGTKCSRKGCDKHALFVDGLCLRHSCDLSSQVDLSWPEKWPDMYQYLFSFFEEHGHFNAEEDPSLKVWADATLSNSELLSGPGHRSDQQHFQILKKSRHRYKKCSHPGGCNKFAVFDRCLSHFDYEQGLNMAAKSRLALTKQQEDAQARVKRRAHLRATLLGAVEAGKPVDLPKAASEVEFDINNPPETFRDHAAGVILDPSDLGNDVAILASGMTHCSSKGGTRGNLHFDQLVHDFQPFYMMSSHGKKPQLAKSLVFIVQNRSGRFVQETEDGKYTVISDEEAVKRTKKALGMGMGTIQKEVKELMEKIENAEKSKQNARAKAEAWEAKYQELVDFHRVQGHCSVGKNHNNPHLQHWLSNQRKSFKNGRLAEDMIDKLQRLGFDFESETADQPAKSREATYQELVGFNQLHGHCSVGSKHNKPCLQKGLANQRQRLSPDRIKTEQPTKAWESKYQELFNFYEVHGHCDIYRAFNKPALRGWTERQRKLYRAKKLSEEKVQKLKLLNFMFVRRKATGGNDSTGENWMERYGEMVKHFEKYGSCRVLKHHNDNRCVGLCRYHS